MRESQLVDKQKLTRIHDGDYVVTELIKFLKGKRSFQGKLSDNKGTYSPVLLPKLGEVNNGH